MSLPRAGPITVHQDVSTNNVKKKDDNVPAMKDVKFVDKETPDNDECQSAHVEDHEMPAHVVAKLSPQPIKHGPDPKCEAAIGSDVHDDGGVEEQEDVDSGHGGECKADIQVCNAATMLSSNNT